MLDAKAKEVLDRFGVGFVVALGEALRSDGNLDRLRADPLLYLGTVAAGCVHSEIATLATPEPAAAAGPLSAGFAFAATERPPPDLGPTHPDFSPTCPTFEAGDTLDDDGHRYALAVGRWGTRELMSQTRSQTRAMARLDIVAMSEISDGVNIVGEYRSGLERLIAGERGVRTIMGNLTLVQAAELRHRLAWVGFWTSTARAISLGAAVDAYPLPG